MSELPVEQHVYLAYSPLLPSMVIGQALSLYCDAPPVSYVDGLYQVVAQDANGYELERVGERAEDE